MLTKYFTKVVVRFNPFGKEAKCARLLLSAIPPAQRISGVTIQNELLTAESTKKPIVKITFKDKTEMEADPSTLNFKELGNHFDRHSRKLSLKESIESQ
ncbi:LAME_0H05160g1_1 [Lachancea meyersii CBS 8951]|uniref:Large ribosomal subunit protein mL53 n=1 Tax=Lachancea meyersii CBS 8951 TaxID=1266667 RepID=A0A1G4KE86_9SACH|nr:LAME_0H05160g1_1 [Lachancea meyersii CBS 8951]